MDGCAPLAADKVDAAQVQNQMNNFLKNVSIMGAMLMLVAFGPGSYSVDKK